MRAAASAGPGWDEAVGEGRVRPDEGHIVSPG